MKNLKNLKGIKMLSKKEQKVICGAAASWPCGRTGGYILSCSWSQGYCEIGRGGEYDGSCCWACY